MSNGYFNRYKKELFLPETKGVISDSIVQNWTRQAYDCYKLNSDCSQCPIANGGYSFKCQMKNIVEILLKTQGLPDEKAIMNAREPQFSENNVA